MVKSQHHMRLDGGDRSRLIEMAWDVGQHSVIQ